MNDKINMYCERTFSPFPTKSNGKAWVETYGQEQPEPFLFTWYKTTPFVKAVSVMSEIPQRLYGQSGQQVYIKLEVGREKERSL